MATFFDKIKQYNIPHEFEAVIEISAGSSATKYEMDLKTGGLVVDRIIPTDLLYPCNYGFIPQTLAGDGDPLDVLVLTEDPLAQSCIISCRPIGILKIEDQSGTDWKLLAMPSIKVCSNYNNIIDIHNVHKPILQKIVYFFEHYKDNEKNKWTKIDGWGNVEEAKIELSASFNRTTDKGFFNF
jgi:inorganic pyrophosphatase